MRNQGWNVQCILVIGTLVVLVLSQGPTAWADQAHDVRSSRIQQGFAIVPVLPDLRGKNRALVGLGNYIINAGGGCNDCHI